MHMPAALTSFNARDVVRYDVPASLVVFLVALPLSLGIAIASGAPVMAGLIAAVVGGIVAGSLGGAPLQVSGPAAGLTVVVAELIANFGFKVTCFITVGAGMLQIVFGLSRIAQAALAIAPVVVHAMLAGIGITIALQQIHVLLGGQSQSSAMENLTALPGSIIDLHWADLLIGGLVVAVMLTWPTLPAKVRKVPGPLVAIVGATLITMFAGLNIDKISIDGNFFDALALPELPSGNWGAVVLGVLTVALIASVESLLSAVAVDKMHTGPRSDFNREMLGQGSANMISGMAGGLPVTGVIVRSSTNVASGARTRASAILHGVWILIFSVLLTALVEQIPMAALAGLLVVIGIQLVKTAHMKLALKTGDLWVYVITVLAVVFLNLLEGVGIGLAIAVLIVVWRVVRAQITSAPIGTEASRQWQITIHGSLSFLALPRLSKALGRVPAQARVTINLDTDFLDNAASEMIEDWKWAHEANGGTVAIEEIGQAHLADAPKAPPKRHPVATKALGLAPWKTWQHRPDANADPDASPILRSIKSGVQEYHRSNADALLEHMTDLSDSQDPDSLFLTCADSRVVPNVITSSGPGDLFTIRNIGNLVPTETNQDTSVEAALEFAINNLGVSSIVVCGHSSCGAMKGLLAGSDDDSALSSWLSNAAPSLAAFRSGHPAGRSAAEAGFCEADQLAIVNVAIQVQTLQRHPLVGRAIADGKLRVAGLFFDITTARVIDVSSTGVAVPT
ncbi:SulP family inorganic anion transporter [Williamsia maris]|uniref:carbonic anhydrase n=1 Tax=Williamsia maris TaxID=72806 RepID=A0ABT1HET4_9NOCA|nr:bifunctional SulP family inorganic anion transporter/carbonic anhydrase [Williamsia maris]MCP2176751.1 carbonic anhydrase [Williamsia maris]